MRRRAFAPGVGHTGLRVSVTRDGRLRFAGGTSSAAPVHTAADCQAQLAAVQGQLPAVQDATGLAHAINTVEANCEKNLQAPGLVNALGHLVLNWQRHQAHEAAKAAKVHGNAGVHGNSGNHGPSSDGTVTGS